MCDKEEKRYCEQAGYIEIMQEFMGQQHWEPFFCLLLEVPGLFDCQLHPIEILDWSTLILCGRHCNACITYILRRGATGSCSDLNKSLSAFCGWHPLAPILAQTNRQQ